MSPLKWAAAPYYGALTAPLALIARGLALAVGGAFFSGAAVVVFVRRFRRA